MPDGTEILSHEPVNASREELASACLEAHDVLMRINPENVARFKEVSQFMAQELKKLKGPSEQR